MACNIPCSSHAAQTDSTPVPRRSLCHILITCLRILRFRNAVQGDWNLPQPPFWIILYIAYSSFTLWMSALYFNNPCILEWPHHLFLISAFLHMLENPGNTQQWLNDPDTGPMLIQISRIYHAEKHAAKVSSASSSSSSAAASSSSSNPSSSSSSSSSSQQQQQQQASSSSSNQSWWWTAIIASVQPHYKHHPHV